MQKIRIGNTGGGNANLLAHPPLALLKVTRDKCMVPIDLQRFGV